MDAGFDLKSFKHDGSSHRMWRNLTLIKEDENYWYLASLRTKVIEDNGREWKTQQPTLYILAKNEFFNVIGMIKGRNVIEYYVNIASPTVLIAPNKLAFIDYDLDLKTMNGVLKELDLNEYQHNANMYGYSDKLRLVVEKTFELLHTTIRNGDKPFDSKNNLKLFQSFVNRTIFDGNTGR